MLQSKKIKAIDKIRLGIERKSDLFPLSWRCPRATQMESPVS